MAAIDKTSNIKIATLDSQAELLDMRFATLPRKRPEVVEGFDPRDYRDIKNEIKPWMAYVNLLRACLGAGMLGIPMAVSQAGMIVGPVMLLFIGCLLLHTHLMLLWCLNEVCRQMKIPMIPYRYGFRLAVLHGPPIFHCIGNHGPTIVAIFMILSQLGICTLFVIFTGDNLRDIMDWKSINPSLVSLFLPNLLLEILMKDLSMISHVVMAGNVLNVISLIIVTVQIVRGPYRETSLVPRSWTSAILAFATMMFNLSAVGVVLSCEKSLKDPRLMTRTFGATTIGMVVPTMLSIVFGPFGFWHFGVMEENILRSLPYDDIVTMVAFGIYLVSVTLSYPLACYPAIQVMLEVIKNHDPNEITSPVCLKATEKVLRPIFVTVSFFCAYMFPFQAPFVAFVGSLCTTLLSLVFPAFMELGLCYPVDYGRFKFILIKDLLIVLLGIVVWVGGVFHCGKLLYSRMDAVAQQAQ